MKYRIITKLLVLTAGLLSIANAYGQDTPGMEDEAAFRNAEWTVTPLPKGGEARSAIIPLFGSVQSINVIRYPATAFRTSVLVAEGEQAGTVSSLAATEDAVMALNASYFNMKTLESATFVKVRREILGETGQDEFELRTNGILSISGNGRHFDISKTSGYDEQTYLDLARGYRYSIASGPVLIEDGVSIPYEIDDSPRGFYTTRHPRTLFGFDGRAGRHGNPGNIYMIVIDGRAPGNGEGASIRECTWIAEMLGLTNAINLDGGGSSTLWSSETGVLNHPSDNRRFDHEGERIVPNIILAK